MYEIDERDRVSAIEDAPLPDVGAPVPVLIADEDRLELAYIAHASSSEGELIAVARFLEPYAHMFGPPNDEALVGHPLADRGLEPCGVFRVEDSSWVRRLERMNSVHPSHQPEMFARLIHYVFTFHDSTFESVADGVEFGVHPASEPVILELQVSAEGPHRGFV